MIPFSKEAEEEERKYIPPDYTEAANKSEDEDDDDIDIDDLDDIEDDDDPAEEEEILSIRESLPEVAPEDDLPFSNDPEPPQTNSRPFFNNPQQQQKPMAWTPNNNQPWSGQPSWQPQTNPTNPWAPKPAQSSPWGAQRTGGNIWAPQGTANTQMQELDRGKRIIICDVLDCLICTLEGSQRSGLIPRDIWDVQLRLDVFDSFRRFSYIERIYAMIPKDLIQNSTSPDNWKSLLDYVARSLASFIRVPSQAVQIVTQSFIAQPKEDMIRCVIKDIPREDIVYIGTQSAGPGQSSVDIDCARALEVDYIDLGNFLMRYS